MTVWARGRAGDLEPGDEILWPDMTVRVIVDWKPAREGLGVTYVVSDSDGVDHEVTYWLDEMVRARVPLKP